jgi:hypothetical protein
VNQPMPPPGPWNTGPMPVTPTPPPLPPPGGPPVPPTGGPGGSGVGPGVTPGGRRSGLVALIAVLATLAVVGIVIGAFWLGRRGNDDTTGTASTTTSSTTSTTTTAPTTTVVPSTVTTTLGDVRAQPAGLFCRDLRAKGFSYPAAVDYWRTQGQPERLDADRNGIPCETVYPTGDVVAYWGTQGVTPTIRSNGVFDLGPGLKCAQLAARGFNVYDAIAYYLNWGEPRNMDADGNGIPCETVYPDAAQVWTGGTGN